MRGLAFGFAFAFSVSGASAYEASTHAGLTERAALAAGLHAVLTDRMGRSLGLFEPLKLVRHKEERGELERRLAQLDREGGYAPDDALKQSALGWLTAGAVLEGVPAERMRNHFWDPTRDRGLSQGGSLAFRTRISDVATGIGSVRGIFTGQSFDGTGSAAPAWVLAPRSDNEWGYARFLDERERAAIARTSAERDDALARALLAAGGILRVLGELGDRAHVRNDYRVALERGGHAYARFVARHYGKSGVPAPGPDKLEATSLVSLLRGLGKETARRFFSAGTLPDSARYAEPLARALGGGGYVSGAVRHLALHQRTAGGFAWTLDDACHLDYAEALLPEIGRHAAAALALLFRGRLEVDRGESRLTARARDISLGAGTFRLLGDDDKGERKPLFERRVSSAGPGDELGVADRPPWARRVIALFRGVDAAGEPIVLVEELPLGEQEHPGP